MRRVTLEGGLRLSGTTPQSWSSGGFLADAIIKGQVDCGTQQQFFFRNSQFQEGTNCWELINGAFVGTWNEGPQQSWVSKFDKVERIAEKPFLVEDNGRWHIAVPHYKSSSSGPGDDTDVDEVSMDDFHVAKDGDSAASINAAIKGKRGLLLTPGFYVLEDAIHVTESNFVVLGIGYPTLVATSGSAMIIEESAIEARVAAILIDAGLPSSTWEAAPPLLHWKGSGGALSDIFTRVGAFQYQRGPKTSCMLTAANVHVQMDGDNTLVDNTWLWHADHDDCGRQSDHAYSGYGLLVQGSGVSVSGLKVEHVFKDHVYWKGENGKMIFLQEELPYQYLQFGSDGHVGYLVDPAVQTHTAHSLGVYIVGACGDMRDVTAIKTPSTASLKNMVGWDNGKDVGAFSALLCQGDQCSKGDCNGDKCRLASSGTSIGCCMWEGGFCDHHDVWCDASPANCEGACQGHWSSQATDHLTFLNDTSILVV